jgi:hypothetical protein
MKIVRHYLPFAHMSSASPLCLCLILTVLFAHIDSQRSADEPHNSAAHSGQPCLFDYKRGEVSDCVYIGRDGSPSISARYLKDLPYQTYGLAAVRDVDGWMYVNRRGKAVITGVRVFDNAQMSSMTV